MKGVSQEAIAKELQKFVEKSIIDHSVVVDPNIPFSDFGVDSVSIIQIVLFIERKFNVTMDEGDLTQDNLKSIHSLSEFIIKNK